MSEFGFVMDASSPKRVPLWQMTAGIVAIIAVLCLIAFRALSGPADFEANTQGALTQVTVNSGDSLRTIGATLADAGVVASTDAFVQAASANLRARYITPGDYKLPAHIPAATAITLLLSPDSRDELRIVVPEGLRQAKIAAIVAQALQCSVDEVNAAIEAADLPPSSNGKAEGYLFPATYPVKRTATATEVVEQMVRRFQQAAVDLELERRARALQLSVHDVVVIASLLEQESAPKDYAKVARVVLNRLAQGMPLQFDSTVNYGLGLSHEKLSQAQLDQDTPYNTYLHEGLPPTPIGNPGAAAIEAALSPARGDWLYFVTTDPKKKITEFARTYEEFLVLKAKYQRNS